MAATTNLQFYKQQLISLSKQELVNLCKAKGLSSDGIESDLINRLMTHQREITSTTSITISGVKSLRSKPIINGQKARVIPPTELLVDGYIREQYTDRYKVIYPHDLTKIFCEFLDHIWVLPQQYNHVMKRNGSLIFRPPLNAMNEKTGKTNVDMIIGYSRGWDRGILEFELKCIKPDRDAIGIMSDIDECEIEQWITATKGNTYYYVAGSKLANGGGIYSGSFTTNSPPEQYIHDEIAWKTGDIIKLRVDCHDWTCKFYKNKIQIGDTINIEPNCTYHPVLATTEDGIEYELIMN